VCSTEYPAFPITAVAGIVFNNNHQVALIKRGFEPRKGQWSIPGGSVETGEALHRALVREIREECSLTVTPGPLVNVVERIVHDKQGAVRFHYVILDYVCYVSGGTLKSGSDAADARWADIETIESEGLPLNLAHLIQTSHDSYGTADHFMK